MIIRLLIYVDLKIRMHIGNEGEILEGWPL